ncbi:MAG TPA: DNA repair protein RecO [Gammaproteobacteria bacterium]|nr:DNA repair protein RecO [Gammaproteobacteria bacterium]
MSSKRVSLQPAFLLHQYAYRDSSRLLELLTRDHGRVGALARGIRSPRSRLRGLLQPFQPLLVSWSGRGDLVTLVGAEAANRLPPLDRRALMSGFYASELILRLLQRHDPHPGAFTAYGALLQALGTRPEPEPALRMFELELLQDLGYGLDPAVDADTGTVVDARGWYRFQPEHGMVAARGRVGDPREVPGHTLLALARRELVEPIDLRHAKRLLRQVLSIYLGERPLRTRGVWAAMQRGREATPGRDMSEEADE